MKMVTIISISKKKQLWFICNIPTVTIWHPKRFRNKMKKNKDEPDLSNFLAKVTMKAQDFKKSKDLFPFAQ